MIPERLVSFIIALSQRERWLIAGLFGFALPLAAVFFWILPLAEARTNAKSLLGQASALQQWVQTKTVENAVLAAQQPQGKSTGKAILGISGIEESLKQAGLRDAVDRLAARDAGAIELRFKDVEFDKLTDWLTEIEPVWGYAINTFRFERTDRLGLVSAEFLLAVGQ